MANTHWALKKAVTVSTPEYRVSCRARLCITYNSTANQGSIFLLFKVTPTDQLQGLKLEIPPQSVEQCKFTRETNESFDPAQLLQTTATHGSDVFTLSLSLSTAGIVLSSTKMNPLTENFTGASDFQTIAEVCRCTFLRVHFCVRQFAAGKDEGLGQLAIFSRALDETDSRVGKFSESHRQNDWEIFPLPPPYEAKHGPPPHYYETAGSGKRHRDSGSISPGDGRRKRLAPLPIGSPTQAHTRNTVSPSPTPLPIDSPTEAATPSTVSPSSPPLPIGSPTEANTTLPSPSIRPTVFTPASSRECSIVTFLRGSSAHDVRKILIQSGHLRLLAPLEDVDGGPPPPFDTNGRRIVQDCLNDAMSEYRDDFFDDCKQNRDDLCDFTDDLKTELQTTANECTEALNDHLQQSLDDMRELGHQLIGDIEKAGIDRRRRVAKYRRSRYLGWGYRYRKFTNGPRSVRLRHAKAIVKLSDR